MKRLDRQIDLNASSGIAWSVTQGRSTVSEPTFKLGLDYRQNLFDNFQSEAAIEGARAWTEVSKYALRNSEQNVLLSAVQAYMNVVRDQLIEHLTRAIADGSAPPAAGSMIRLFSAQNAWMQSDTALRVAAGAAVAGPSGDDPLARVGVDYLFRAAWSLAGGSTEMARNIISERVLGMPREPARDRDVPFRDVPRGSSARH